MQDYIYEQIERFKQEYADCPAPVISENVKKRRFLVPMRDGVRLETFVFLPGMQQETCPVILNRTCYPQNGPVLDFHGGELAKRGFGFIYQFCRGQGASEGEWKPNIYERQDGIDTVDWICAQPWAGRIGVWGRSYEALTGWAMADAVTGKVTSMFLGAYGTDRFSSAWQKGSFRQDVLTSWTMDNAGFPIDADYEESLRFMPQAAVDEVLWGERIDWYRDYICNDKVTDAYWQSGWWKQLREIPGKIKIPLYITSGWYDHHHGSSMLTWERLSDASKEHSWLSVSSLNHFQLPCIEGRSLNQDKNEEIRQLFDWFDLTLVKGKTPSQRLRFYEIGADCWHEMRSGEPGHFNCQEKVFFLDAENEKKQLLTTLNGTENRVSYCYDPDHPVRTHGGEALLKSAMLHTGSRLQPALDYRPDVPGFISEPMADDLHIFGKIRVKLWVSSDCEDTAFTAKLCEVFPDGTTYNIRSSITTISSDCPEGVYTPGEPVSVEIEMWEICYRVQAGNRLRLDISSSDFPQYSIHPNYAGNWALQEKSRSAHQTIFCGDCYASQLLIPLAAAISSGREGRG